MKSVLLSIRPKWCEKILSGEKIIEVRKFAPKEVPFKCFIYATKKEYLQCMFRKGEYIFSDDHSKGKFDENIFVKNRLDWQGKVIGEFICDKVDEIVSECRLGYSIYSSLRDTCLTVKEIQDYGKGKTLYGWHISDLKIYDKPRELSEFIKPCPYGDSPCQVCEYYSDYSGECRNIITRQPQSWMYVEEIETR